MYATGTNLEYPQHVCQSVIEYRTLSVCTTLITWEFTRFVSLRQDSDKWKTRPPVVSLIRILLRLCHLLFCTAPRVCLLAISTLDHCCCVVIPRRLGVVVECSDKVPHPAKLMSGYYLPWHAYQRTPPGGEWGCAATRDGAKYKWQSASGDDSNWKRLVEKVIYRTAREPLFCFCITR